MSTWAVLIGKKTALAISSPKNTGTNCVLLTNNNTKKGFPPGFVSEKRLVQTTTLTAIFNTHINGEIDFMTIDVEG